MAEFEWKKSNLVNAASNNEPRVVEAILLKYPSQVDLQLGGCTALQAASRKGHVEIMKILANAGADLDYPDEQYNTPLHFAVNGDRPEAVELLLNLGANMLEENKEEETPPQLAFRKDHNSCLQKFLRQDPTVALARKPEQTYCSLPGNETLEKKEQDQEKKDSQEVVMCCFCNDEPAIVNFQTCGHTVACFLCSFRNDACKECGKAITSISFTNTKQVSEYMDRVKNFHNKIQGLEDMHRCPICKDRMIDCTLQCGHMFCHKCVRKRRNTSPKDPRSQDWICHLCRRPSRYTKLFPIWPVPDRKEPNQS